MDLSINWTSVTAVVSRQDNQHEMPSSTHGNDLLPARKILIPAYMYIKARMDICFSEDGTACNNCQEPGPQPKRMCL